MAKKQLLDILMYGSGTWNIWRKRHAGLHFPDLTGANLARVNLSGANLEAAILSEADLTETDLSGANLSFALLHDTNLSGALLHGANLSGTSLWGANLSNANLSGANLHRADLSSTNLFRANLSGASLFMAVLVETNLREAILTNCSVYGISVWDVLIEGARQDNLVITYGKQPRITVDNLKVAQFIYLLLNNKEIRDVIDTITSKVVLILGRFTSERKAVLNALRDELRRQNYLPVVFDFEKPASRDLTETVSTLAHLARFIIVDLTDPSSAPHEVATIIPQCIVPVQPLLFQNDAKPRHEYAMFQDLIARYHWVLPTHKYQDTRSLLANLKELIIEPAEQKAQELAKR
jgi:uncharacterized protein YjbI with pentapeptide repeats